MAQDTSDRARQLRAVGDWAGVRELLTPERSALVPQDVELLAVACGLTGANDLGEACWEQSHHAWLDRGDIPRAARAAIWLGLGLASQGRTAPASGWFARGQRLLDDAGIECAETGLTLVPVGLAHLDGDAAASLAVFGRVVDLGRRYGSTEVTTLGLLGSGQATITLGDVPAGVALLDEALVTATTEDIIPIAVGIVYCAVIFECNRIFDLRRAHEWTRELDRWSSGLRGLVPFRGQCLVHRSELAQMRGDWDTATQEVDDACAHFAATPGDRALGMALYQRAELYRVRGMYELAEETYDRSAERGHRVAPGRQLLMLDRGELGRAAAASRVSLQEATSPVGRAGVLAAHVEIMVAVGEPDEARAAAEELADLAASFGTPMLSAVAGRCRGLVHLAASEPADALRALDPAVARWLELGVRYEAARAEALVAEACAQLGDHDRAARVRERAARVFEELGARPDLERLRVGGGAGTPAAGPGGALSPRELEVVVLLAKGLTNRDVAAALVISEKTVARHVSNIFTKLDVTTRGAAGAWAHRHGLVDR